MPKRLKFTGPFIVVLISVTVVSTAQAQTTDVFVELARLVEEGERVRIIRADGGEIIGDLSTVGPAAIDVEVDGRMVRLSSADVREVAIRDSLRNGILIGLGAGLAAGFGIGMLTSEDLGNHGVRGLAVIVSTAMGGGVGIGIGAAVDALNRHYNTVYRASSRVVRVSPVVSPKKGYGAVVSIAW